MKNTNFNTKTASNKYTILDKMFDRLIREVTKTGDIENEIRFETYDLILYELKREYNYDTYNEIKYRLTDGENINDVFYDIILRGDYSSPLIWLFKQRIEEYIEKDKYNRFYE